VRLREAEKHYEAGQDLMGREAFQQAERAFERALASEPRFYIAHYGLGQALLAQKRYPAAIDAYSRCRETAADLNATFQREQIRADQRREDDLREAQDILRRLQSTVQTNPAAQMDIYRIESRIETLQLSKMRGMEQRFDVPPGLYVGLGSAYLRTGQLEDAEKAYESAVKADGGLGEAHNNLAFVYFKTGRYELATEQIRLAEKAGVRVHPQFKKDVDKAAKQ
jgi:tetratricopeptide (TPR) repeat protein